MSTWEEGFLRRIPPESRLELLEVCWRFRSPTGRVLECRLYAVATAVEVRAAFSEEDVVRTHRTINVSTARELAAEWRQALVKDGVFRELPLA